MIDRIDRRLAWEGCLNIRDLGGYPASKGRLTRWGMFLRGDSLARLSPSGRAALWEYGVRTIIDLRSAEELAAAPNPFAEPASDPRPGYLSLPLFGQERTENAPWIIAAYDLAALYEIILQRFSEQITQTLRAIAEAPPGGVLFHCHAGKDRTGLTAMFLLAIAGVNDETIIADYAESTDCLAPVNNEILARYADTPAEQAHVARLLITEPRYMRATLEYLAQDHGGPLGYLQAAGLSDGELVRLRDRLLEP